MEAIVISGFPAAGKTTVANILGKLLGVKVVGGGDILREMAKDRGYKVDSPEWWDNKESIEFLKERETNPDFDKEADKRLEEKIDRGSIVITSYTAPWLFNKGFKVWLKCSIENRAKRMSDRDKIKVERSIEIMKIRDHENIKIYRKVYNLEFGKNLDIFDLEVDTNNKTPEEVAQAIISHYNERSKRVKEAN